MNKCLTLVQFCTSVRHLFKNMLNNNPALQEGGIVIFREPDLDIFFYCLCAAIEADRFAVQAQVIVAAVVPLMSGIVFIVLCPVLVDLVYVMHRCLSAQGTSDLCLFQAYL